MPATYISLNPGASYRGLHDSIVVCVIDFHVEPPPDRTEAIGHRPTG